VAGTTELATGTTKAGGVNDDQSFLSFSAAEFMQ
jgi:hypothetical protein